MRPVKHKEITFNAMKTPLSQLKNQLQIIKNFLNPAAARRLRKEYDEVFCNPRHSHPKRFLWDHWYLDDQYRMHRTPAEYFFTRSSYELLCNKLVNFGQRQLGCHSISKPWLSFYVDGDFQSLHTDNPHGPWAYVYSLTEWHKRDFLGGDTFILKPEILNYWSHFSRHAGAEKKQLFNKIPPLFNQLLIFDPRLPHGVEPVRSVFDPTKARLVVHGWFVDPEPFVTGGLKNYRLQDLINRQMTEKLSAHLRSKEITGTLILRVNILTSGKVANCEILTNHLIDRRTGQVDTHFTKVIKNHYLTSVWPRSQRRSELTLPFIFDS